MLRPAPSLKSALSLHRDVNLKFDLERHVLRNNNHNYENVQRWRQKSSVAALESDAVALDRGEPVVSPFSAPLLAPPSGGQHHVVLNSDIFPSFHVTDIVGLELFR